MLLKLIPLLLSCITLINAAPSGLYLEAGVATSDTNKLQSSNTDYLYDTPTITSFSLGYQDDLYRYEIEEHYLKADLSSASVASSHLATSGKITYVSQLLNFYYSGYNKSNLVSSIGLGGGITSRELKNDMKDKNIFTAQGMFSLGYISNEHLITTFKYTYFYMKGSKHFQADGSNLLTFSLRYIF